MKVNFHIHYITAPGETIYITVNTPLAGAESKPLSSPLTLAPDGLQSVAIEIPAALEEVSYRYFLLRPDGSKREEWGADRRLRFASTLGYADVYDCWQDEPSDKPFRSSAFTDCIFRRESTARFHSLKPGQLMISVDASTVPSDAVLAIVGSCPALGNWDPAQGVVMNDSLYPRFTAWLPLAEVPEGTMYKFVMLNASTREVLTWEEGSDRMVSIVGASGRHDNAIALTGLFFRNPLPRWRGAGVAIPVFSLRSEEDWGVGDFTDIKKLADWAHLTGQQFIQLLPINDTTMTHSWADSYPYNSISSFALHPMYLRVDAIGTLRSEQRMEYYRREAAKLNTSTTVDYEGVNQLKTQYTRELFAEQGSETTKSEDFKKFVETNARWLRPYAAFCALRDRYRTASTRDWEEYATYVPSRIAKFISHNQEEINYIYFLQYHLDRQLKEARDYAHSLGIAIKGDIPIGISSRSVDAWLYPRLFNLEAAAGAPPDAFAEIGQNWGFPTYNWEEMSLDNFAWWKDRFRKMAQYFDAYRIDHVLGFFRIWQIPLHAIHGLLGVFNAALPLTPAEMADGFGFHFQLELMTTPYIRPSMLPDFFGDLAEEARHRFFNARHNDVLTLKPEFATQRQVAAYFASTATEEHSQRMAKGLLSLIDQVLFIEDPYRKGMYHPRIEGRRTYIYRALPEQQKWCFDRMYEDFYYHRNNQFWYEKAMWKLPPIIDATRMLTCAEDLGMIPACVGDVMARLQILSLEIQRMPKDPDETFANPMRYPYLSVCTTSTHDMGGIRQWWEENPAMKQLYYNNVLHQEGEAPRYAEPWICHRILKDHLASPAMLCILPLQDWLSIDGNLRRIDPREEQINDPANSANYWRYRMHLTIETLLKAKGLNSNIFSLISESGR